MYEELNAELNEGSRLAKALVEHVVMGMGAGGCQIPITFNGPGPQDGQEFLVTVQPKLDVK